MAWPKGRPRKTPTLAERFWPRVNKDAPGGCWEWTASISHYGYGAIFWRGYANYAHRVVFELLGRKIPAGMEVDHICRNRKCCNPEHLRFVTKVTNSVENNLSPLARNHRKTHCKNGHEFTPENTAVKYRDPIDGPGRMKVGRTKTRICLTCRPFEWRHALIPRPRPPGSRYKRTDPDFEQQQRWDCHPKG